MNVCCFCFILVLKKKSAGCHQINVLQKNKACPHKEGLAIYIMKEQNITLHGEKCNWQQI